MAAQPNAASQVISETAKAEGGPHKGSSSAQMQSEVGRTQNFEQAAQEVGSKMQNAPGTITSEVRTAHALCGLTTNRHLQQDAAHIKSREARVLGQANPPADSISADAQHLAAVNEGATKSTTANGTSSVNPVDQSARDRLNNFQHATEQVAPKMAQAPEHVTKEDADMLHSREQRAFGATSKGGIASQAQSMAAENEKQGAA